VQPFAIETTAISNKFFVANISGEWDLPLEILSRRSRLLIIKQYSELSLESNNLCAFPPQKRSFGSGGKLLSWVREADTDVFVASREGYSTIEGRLHFDNTHHFV
jgi:hypothetical protein